MFYNLANYFPDSTETENDFKDFGPENDKSDANTFGHESETENDFKDFGPEDDTPVPIKPHRQNAEISTNKENEVSKKNN